MSDFVVVPSRVPEAMQRIIDLEKFRQSAPYVGLGASDRSLPHLLFGAFGMYLLDRSQPEASTIAAMQQLNLLAGWQDPDVNGHIVVDVLELFDAADWDRLHQHANEPLALLAGIGADQMSEV
jgi:hypothetical protein